MAEETILVSNISNQLLDSHIKELFECCGPIAKMSNDKQAGTCTITFTESAHAKAAVFLAGTPLGDRPLNVVLYSTEAHRKAQSKPTIPDIINQNRADEIARTIYVGNVNANLTEDQVQEFFSACGPVVITKLAGEGGDATRPVRFAFVEFAHTEAVVLALGMGGTNLAGFPLKIRKANNAIMKPSTTVPVKKDINEIMAKVLAATSQISKKVDSKRSRSRDRSRRSRSRSRDRSRRSRSHSRGRASGGDDIKCYNCGEKGHISRNCRKSRSRSPLVKPAKKTPTVDRTGMFFNGYKWEPIAP